MQIIFEAAARAESKGDVQSNMIHCLTASAFIVRNPVSPHWAVSFISQSQKFIP